MTTTLPAAALLPRALSPAQFQGLAEVPPEIEWFANLTNANTRRAYQQDIEDFMAFTGLQKPEQFREATRAHVIAWRAHLTMQELANDTIRRKLAALSSLYAYLCDRNTVLHNLVLGVEAAAVNESRRSDPGARRSPSTSAAGGPARRYAEGQAGSSDFGYVTLLWAPV